MTINNDSEFKAALSSLPGNRQRQVAARFAESVLVLSKDARVKNASRERPSATRLPMMNLTLLTRQPKKPAWTALPNAEKSATGTARPATSSRKPRWPALSPGREQSGMGIRDACAHGAHQRKHRHRYRHRQRRDHRAIPHSGQIFRRKKA